MTWLAYTYSPETTHRLARPAARKQGVLREPVPARVRDARSNGPGPTGSPASETFQQANLEADPQVPADAVHGSVAAARWDRSRGRSSTRQTGTLYAAFNCAGHRGAHGVDLARRRERRHLVDIKGPTHLPGHLDRLGSRPGTIFYTTDNHAHRDLMALDPRRGATRGCRRTCASASWPSIAPTSRSGACAR